MGAGVISSFWVHKIWWWGVSQITNYYLMTEFTYYYYYYEINYKVTHREKETQVSHSWEKYMRIQKSGIDFFRGSFLVR